MDLGWGGGGQGGGTWCLRAFVELEPYPGEQRGRVAVRHSACLCPVPTPGPCAAILASIRPRSLSQGQDGPGDVSTRIPPGDTPGPRASHTGGSLALLSACGSDMWGLVEPRGPGQGERLAAELGPHQRERAFGKRRRRAAAGGPSRHVG